MHSSPSQRLALSPVLCPETETLGFFAHGYHFVLLHHACAACMSLQPLQGVQTLTEFPLEERGAATPLHVEHAYDTHMCDSCNTLNGKGGQCSG